MKIRIGTRKSRLALAQTEMVRCEILKAFPDAEVEIVHVSTIGDRVTDRPLEKIGGSGVFVKEIEQQLLDNRIDIAVHSAKDLPVQLADGLTVAGVLKRGDPRDMLVLRSNSQLNQGSSLKETLSKTKFPRPNVGTHEADLVTFPFDQRVLNIGTGSLRRRQNLKHLYPNVSFSDIRGNVDTRLRKLYDGEYDGIVLACAGAERLHADLSGFKVIKFGLEEFLPAACQAIIAIECRMGSDAESVVRAISDRETMIQFETEKEVLKQLCADCQTPVSAYSHINESGTEIYLSASLDPENIISASAPVCEHILLAKRIVKGLLTNEQ